MSDTTKRGDVLDYFGWRICHNGEQCDHEECAIPLKMADEIVRLGEGCAILKGYYDDAVKVGTECAEKMRRAKRILAALREPSDAVLMAATMHYGDVRDLIIVAVAAAEQEVGE